MEQTYTTEQIAEFLHVTKVTVQRWISSGKLKATRIGKRYIITKDDFETFMIRN